MDRLRGSVRTHTHISVHARVNVRTDAHTCETKTGSESSPDITFQKILLSAPKLGAVFSSVPLERARGLLNGHDSTPHVNRSSEARIFCGSQMSQLD